MTSFRVPFFSKIILRSSMGSSLPSWWPICSPFSSAFTAIGLFIKMVCVSDAVLFPLILVVALIGTYSVNSSLFDVGSCIGFGILGWILKRYGYPAAPVVLGIVLGKLIEYNFRRGIIMGGYGVFYTDTLAFFVLLLAMFSLFYPLIRAGLSRYKKGRPR